jgi:hypothetical protein
MSSNNRGETFIYGSRHGFVGVIHMAQRIERAPPDYPIVNQADLLMYLGTTIDSHANAFQHFNCVAAGAF